MKLLVNRTPPRKPLEDDDLDERPKAAKKILRDRDHESGKAYRVAVNYNDGQWEETVLVHASNPGLACNRAFKVAKAEHREAKRIRCATFDVEAM